MADESPNAAAWPGKGEPLAIMLLPKTVVDMDDAELEVWAEQAADAMLAALRKKGANPE